MSDNHPYVEATDQTFEAEVLKFNGVAVVDFWAPWCGPCHMLAPAVEAVAEANRDNSQVKVVKVMVDDNPEVSEKYRVMSIPTLKYFKNGEMVDESVGVVPQDEISQKLTQYSK